MNENEIKDFILSRINYRITRLGIEPEEITKNYDLVKSGLLDSMSFIDLVVDIEKKYNIEIDFESAFEQSGFTTLAGLTRTVEKELNE